MAEIAETFATDAATDTADSASTGADWRARSRCRGMDANIFFPDTEDQAGPAKAICATCPVREPCLEFALATRQMDGIWGGLTETERRRLRRRRQDRARAARMAAA